MKTTTAASEIATLPRVSIVNLSELQRRRNGRGKSIDRKKEDSECFFSLELTNTLQNRKPNQCKISLGTSGHELSYMLTLYTHKMKVECLI